MQWRRREWLLAAGALPLVLGTPALALPARALVFPRDFGSHPELRTEWWYITGHVRANQGLYGFQVTFFRSRVDSTQALQSPFAARQLIFAHAALTDLQTRKQWHDQRIAREGFGIAEASQEDTHVKLRDWSLTREDTTNTASPPLSKPGSRYTARLPSEDFSLDLVMTATQPVLLQGAQGLSRKGPDASQASYYYSEPQLAVSGAITVAGRRMVVDAAPAPDNRAWMDHEWSEALMHDDAVGWDWIGMNLDDGSALTAFRLRRADGSTVWTGGSFRPSGDVQPRVFQPGDVRFTAERTWHSTLSQATYPVQWKVDTPQGMFTVRALLDEQELDSRGSTGAIYWEGLCELLDAKGRPVGRGYLEMTGYADRLNLRAG